MNRLILMGRLTKDPEIKENGESHIARFSMAVDRRFKREGEDKADFFQVVAFGKQADFASKWLKQGVKIIMEGRIENNNYTNRDGQKVYRDQIVAESLEFAESKKAAAENGNTESAEKAPSLEGFMRVPDNVTDEELPFN